MPGHKTRSPERTVAALPKGWREGIERADARSDRSPAGWLRSPMRPALESSGWTDRRTAGGK